MQRMLCEGYRSGLLRKLYKALSYIDSLHKNFEIFDVLESKYVQWTIRSLLSHRDKMRSIGLCPDDLAFYATHSRFEASTNGSDRRLFINDK